MDDTSSSSSSWNASLSVLKRKTSSMRQSLVQKDERISELEKQLDDSQLQVQEQGQVIAEREQLEKELRNQVWKADEESFKLKKENVHLKSEGEKWAKEAEKWREVATQKKTELEAALRQKAELEEQIRRMEEDVFGLSQTLEEIDDEEMEEVPASIQPPQEVVNPTESGRGRTAAFDDLMSPTRSQQRSDSQPQLRPSTSSSSLVPSKSSAHHGRDPSKTRGVTCLCGSSFGTENGLAQHVRYQTTKASSRASLKEREVRTPANTTEERNHSAVSSGQSRRVKPGQGQSPKSKRTKVQYVSSSSESENE